MCSSSGLFSRNPPGLRTEGPSYGPGGPEALARYCKDHFLFKGKWIFSYEPIDSANFVVLERTRTKKVEARRPVYLFDTTKSTLIKTFKSSLEAQTYFKADYRTILQYCESGKIFR